MLLRAIFDDRGASTILNVAPMSTVLQELLDAVGTLGMRMMQAMQAHSVGHITYYNASVR